jgi:hypothetical protein
MREVFCAIATTLSVFFQLSKPGGYRAVAAEMLILRVQLMTVQRGRKKSPPLSPLQRLLLAFASAFVVPRRLARAAVLVKPATILKFHRLLVKRKYKALYSNKARQSGRPRTDRAIKNLVIEIKRENPDFGCPRIAATVADRTGIEISEESVRRILKTANLSDPTSGPSWLSFLGNQIDSLWSVDMFKAESILIGSWSLWTNIAAESLATQQ